jgi:large subunit ribosomal protein L21
VYAIVEAGGKQYRAEPGKSLSVERLSGERGDRVELDRVLLVADGAEVRVGTPTIPGARVVGEIVRQGRGPKLTVFKFKRRRKYRRKQGHRQALTTLRVREIVASPDGESRGAGHGS